VANGNSLVNHFVNRLMHLMEHTNLGRRLYFFGLWEGNNGMLFRMYSPKLQLFILTLNGL